jgi:hypothetical protein
MLALSGRKSCPHSWQKFSLQSLTVEQLGQVRVLGRAADVAAGTTEDSTIGAATAAVEGTTAGAVADMLVDAAVAGVAAVVVVVVVVLAGVKAVGVGGGMGKTGAPTVATVERRARIITNASASSTRTTTISSSGSQGKLLDAGAVPLVDGLLPVDELFG